MNTVHHLLMLAFPGAQLLDVTGPLQMFAGANDALGRQAYRTTIAAPQAGPFQTSSGVSLVADVAFAQVTPEYLSRVATLMVAGGDPGVRQQLAAGVVTAVVADAAARVPRLASVCSGAFILASAGALDGRRATTHWDAVEALKRFRPAVEVDGDAIHVEDCGVWTSAGVTAGMDLALAMIEADHGRDIALAIARRHVIFRIRPGGQSQFSAELAAQTAASNDRIQKLIQKVIAEPRRDWRTEALAHEAGLSQRSLSRLFQAALHASPADFVERVRVDLARRKLLESEASVEAIAFECGFGSLRRMDRAFARTVAVSPTDFRARFRSLSRRKSRKLPWATPPSSDAARLDREVPM